MNTTKPKQSTKAGNGDLPTIDIKGKEYVLVKDRILYFNEHYPNGRITTAAHDLEGGAIRMRACIWPDIKEADRYFVGHSESIRGGAGVDKTAACENAETSAVGRALAMMGIGVIESIASADEVHKAINAEKNVPTITQDDPTPTQTKPKANTNRPISSSQIALIKKLCGQKGLPIPDDEWFGNASSAVASAAIDKLLAQGAKATGGVFATHSEGPNLD